MDKIKVDIVSDVVCPWCYIGKRRLEKAVAELKDDYEFEINYLPFELNPDMPKEGRNQKEYLTQKFGGPERYIQLTNHVKEVAAGEGLQFNYEKQTMSPNTRDAHRIIWLAKEYGLQIKMKEALMNAYFEKGVDLTKRENLIQIAAELGLEHNLVKEMLDSDKGMIEVEYLEQLNYKRGVSGVPFYIINDKYGVSGAQPTETFKQVFKEISEKVVTDNS